MKKLLQIITVIIIVVGIIMLAFSYVATVVYADDGYPAPIDYGYPVGYPIYIGYPVDVGYPVYDHYPVTGYSEPLPCYPIDYPVIPIDPLYPEPVIQPSINPVQLEPITPQYRNGRNLWQEIVYQFGYLLELMK
jgi:hypothetical protein